MKMPFSVGCVIMASGQSRRFGSNKLLADFCGQPMLCRAFAATATPNLAARIVVTRAVEVQALCTAHSIPVLLHQQPGRNDTVRLGLSALLAQLPELAGCMFLPGDQPLLRRESVEALTDAFCRDYSCLTDTQKETKQVIANITQSLENNEEVTNKIDESIQGHKVVGIIKIPELNIEYPILENTNKETLNLSITKFWGNRINEIGNVTLAGHNNLNRTMFGKIKKMQEGDIIELTDIQNVTLKYQVFKVYVIDPNDITCILPEQENVREVTLITCTNGNKNRLIVKAREI